MRDSKPLRHKPSSRRVGADAAFAKAMARAEFGRFYTDDREQEEIARSLARGKRNGATPHAPSRSRGGKAATTHGAERDPPDAAKKSRVPIWRQPSLRERRSELALAKARLRRKPGEEPADE